MSSAKSHETLSRQWELLKIIPLRGQGKTAAELTQALTDQGFQISKRTVERDLNDLSLVFPLLTDDSCSPQRWGWMDEKDVQLPGISVVEAVMLQLVEGTLLQILPLEMLPSFVRPMLSRLVRILCTCLGHCQARCVHSQMQG